MSSDTWVVAAIVAFPAVYALLVVWGIRLAKRKNVTPRWTWLAIFPPLFLAGLAYMLVRPANPAPAEHARALFAAGRTADALELLSTRSDAAIPDDVFERIAEALIDRTVNVRAAARGIVARSPHRLNTARHKAMWKISNGHFRDAAAIGHDAIEPLIITLSYETADRAERMAEALAETMAPGSLPPQVRAIRDVADESYFSAASFGAVSIPPLQWAYEKIRANGELDSDRARAIVSALGNVGGEAAGLLIEATSSRWLAREANAALLSILRSDAAGIAAPLLQRLANGNVGQEWYDSQGPGIHHGHAIRPVDAQVIGELKQLASTELARRQSV